MSSSAPIDVCLFGPKGQWRPSMDRFAGDLVNTQSADFNIRDATVAQGSSAPLTARQEWVRRWLVLPKRARAETSDVFHITDHSYAQVAIGLPPLRTVITCHDLIPLRAASTDLGFRLTKRQLAQYRLSVSFLRRAARVVAISAATRDDAINLLGVAAERVSVIPHGVGAHFVPLTPSERTTARTALGLGGEFAVAHIGAFPYKNPEAVVRVLAELVPAAVNPVVIQIGTPWPDSVLRLADELGVRDRVRSLGRVSDAEMVRALGAADAMLFPSHWEGFGYPVAEAMSCAKPVVVSDVPALIELVGSGGRYAPATDISGLAAHLRVLATDPVERDRLGRDGLERSAMFTLQLTRTAYLNLYREVALDAADTPHGRASRRSEGAK